MELKDLIRQSSLYLAQNARRIERPFSGDVFQQGGEWMQAWLVEWDPLRKWNSGAIAFNAYGWAKYLISMAAFLGSAWVFYAFDPWLLPLSVIVFYIVEVHFLFLFPLLIDGVEHPLWQSISITYRIGLWRVLAKVIPLGLFMILGLFQRSDPLRNWYKGCLALLIWYEQEVRDRI